MHRIVAATLTTALAVFAPASASAETVKGSMNSKNTKAFVFIPDNDGVVSITVMAAKSATYILLVIDSSGDITWCSGISDERMIRCEFTGVAGDVTGIGLLTVSGTSKFDLNVTGPVDEFVFRQPDRDLEEKLNSAARTLRDKALAASRGSAAGPR